MRLQDLSRVPPPDVVEELDFEAALAAALADLQARWTDYDTLLESDPAVKLLESAIYVDTIYRARVNDAARACLLPSATGADLDGLAAWPAGTERQSGETDASLRARAQIGLHQLAAAGSRERYIWHALDADAAVLQADAWTVTTGAVGVAVLARVESARAGLTAEQIAIGAALFGAPATTTNAYVVGATDSAPFAAARTRLLSDEVAPLGCDLQIQAPEILPYTVDATLVIPPGPDAATVLAAAHTALDAYVAHAARFRIDATRAGIIAALVVPDVRDVILGAILGEPAADIVSGPGQIAVCTDVTLAVEVRDD